MRPKLSIKEMVEVFELRVKGVAWENLAIIFGVNAKTLVKYHRQAARFGFDFWTDLRE